MLRRFSKLPGQRVIALDGESGKVCDLYLDDIDWMVRHLVVETRVWLPGCKVLISPRVVECVDRDSQTLSVSLTRERIEKSPPADSAKPVSRQQPQQLDPAAGYPASLPRLMNWDKGPVAPITAPGAKEALAWGQKSLARVLRPQSHLRSAKELLGYTIAAIDGYAGHLKDLLFDDETWALRYLIIERTHMPFARRTLLRLTGVRGVKWDNRHIDVNLTLEQIARGCDFNPDNLPLGDLESALHRAAAGSRRELRGDPQE